MVSQLVTSGFAIPPSHELRDRLNELSSRIATDIKGQDHVLAKIVPALIRGELGLTHPRRPRASFLFVGPTGVGKTELTNVFTSQLMEGRLPLRFDMSEYQLQTSVEKLIGGDAADPGLLGRAVSGAKSGTLLFDEIEKAHPLLLDLFLQMLDDARITLATGEVLDLRGFYIVMTSNLGSSESMRMESAPFASVERTVLMRVRENLRPELVGRVSEIAVFARLSYESQRSICENMVASECHRLAAQGHSLEVSQQMIEELIREGYNRLLGARPMRHAVENFLQNEVAMKLLGLTDVSNRASSTRELS